MARLLMAAMRAAGHEVNLVSQLRSYASSPLPAVLGELKAKADRRGGAHRGKLAQPGRARTYGSPITPTTRPPTSSARRCAPALPFPT